MIANSGISCETAIKQISLDPLMVIQHLFTQWLGAVKQQAIIWSSVDKVLRHYMEFLGVTWRWTLVSVCVGYMDMPPQ